MPRKRWISSGKRTNERLIRLYAVRSRTFMDSFDYNLALLADLLFPREALHPLQSHCRILETVSLHSAYWFACVSLHPKLYNWSLWSRFCCSSVSIFFCSSLFRSANRTYFFSAALNNILRFSLLSCSDSTSARAFCDSRCSASSNFLSYSSLSSPFFLSALSSRCCKSPNFVSTTDNEFRKPVSSCSRWSISLCSWGNNVSWIVCSALHFNRYSPLQLLLLYFHSFLELG